MTETLFIVIFIVFTAFLLISLFASTYSPSNKQKSEELEKFEVGDKVLFKTDYVYSNWRNKTGVVEYANNEIRLWGVKFDDGTVYEVGYHGYLVKLED